MVTPCDFLAHDFLVLDLELYDPYASCCSNVFGMNMAAKLFDNFVPVCWVVNPFEVYPVCSSSCLLFWATSCSRRAEYISLSGIITRMLLFLPSCTYVKALLMSLASFYTRYS